MQNLAAAEKKMTDRFKNMPIAQVKSICREMYDDTSETGNIIFEFALTALVNRLDVPDFLAFEATLD